MIQQPIVKEFFDPQTHTFSYVVSDSITQKCAVIDSVLDYEPVSAATSTKSADKIIVYIKENQLSVEWILETHIHADHLTAAQYLKDKLGGKIAMSHKVSIVQDTFRNIYDIGSKEFNSNLPFDYLFADHEIFKIGGLDAYNIPTPGHTPACLIYVIGDTVFVCDTLFMPDYGTARCDFPKGSPEALYDSVQKLYQLPDGTRVFLCHDYLPDGREEYSCQTDILSQKRYNIHINQNIKKKNLSKCVSSGIQCLVCQN